MYVQKSTVQYLCFLIAVLHGCCAVMEKLEMHLFSYSTSVLWAGVFVWGVMNTRNRAVLFREHDRLKNDWWTIAVAYISQQHPFTSYM